MAYSVFLTDIIVTVMLKPQNLGLKAVVTPSLVRALYWPSLIICSLLAFLPLLPSFFQEDDFALLDAVANGGPFGIWTHHGAPFFRPIISLTFWAQYQLFGVNPIAYRLLNDLIHAGCAGAIGFLAMEFAPANRLRAGCMTALLFLFAPSHAEAVNWICARTDLIACFFGIWSFLLFVRYLRINQPVKLFWSILFLLLALLSKESALTIPIAMAVCLQVSKKPNKPHVFVILALTIALYIFLRLVLIGLPTGSQLDRAKGAQLAILTIIQVARAAMPGLPFADSALHNLGALKTPGGALIFLAGLALASFSMFSGFKLMEKSQRVILAAIGIGFWLPAAGLSVHLLNSNGERFLYLPSAVLFICLGVFLSQLERHRMKYFFGLMIFYIGLLGWQNFYWRQAAALSEEAARSFCKTAAPFRGQKILVIDAPGQIQGGGYGLVFQYATVADLMGHFKIFPIIGSIVFDYSPGHRIEVSRNGKLTSADGLGFFSPVDGGLEPRYTRLLLPDASKPECFRAMEIKNGSKLVCLFWDGEKFRALPTR